MGCWIELRAPRSGDRSLGLFNAFGTACSVEMDHGFVDGGQSSYCVVTPLSRQVDNGSKVSNEGVSRGRDA